MSGLRVEVWLAVLLLLLPGVAPAEERILDFASRIDVAFDGSMEVTETIRVRAEGDKIQHGIYRDFPTHYRDRGGNRVHVAFEALGASRDDEAEAFFSESRSNGVRVYIGDKDAALASGVYTYTLRYRTHRQLGFFADHDELYWNATGNDWAFPIDHASASVRLPGELRPEQLKLGAYTGPEGSQGSDYVAQVTSNGAREPQEPVLERDPDAAQATSATVVAPVLATFASTRVLEPGEGLTLVVEFPKGIVLEPSREQRLHWFLQDNGGVLALGAGLLLVLAWYLLQWFRFGRDPRPGVIIARYEAPPGTTPSDLRYVQRMGWDTRCAAADLVDAAVRGAVRIRKSKEVFQLERAERVDLPERQGRLVDDLLQGKQQVSFSPGNHERIGNALKAHQKSLDEAHAGRDFQRNTRYVVIGALLSLAVLIGATLYATDGPEAFAVFFLFVWLSVWSFAVGTLSAAALHGWYRMFRPGGGSGSRSIGATVLLSVMAVPFWLGEIVALLALTSLIGLAFATLLFILIVLNVLFLWLMRAPTREGRKLLDQIEGLRRYLSVAERDTLARLKEPPMSTEQFERMLPWALALGVEENWTNRFAEAVGPAVAATTVSSINWYHGGSIGNVGSFASGLGSSLSGAISSSSRAPGSSSGGGGGGSSGGGGGGGGGGGW